MDYVAPLTVEEAWRALETEDARCLAGGQSLVAMMNLGLVSPSRLVSLRRIVSLRGIGKEDDGSLRIGAMTTHAELAALDTAECGPALLARAARVVAYPAVRAFGTIGGSVAHADPASDYPVALVAADAAIEVASASGMHRIAARDFFRGLFETALKPGEIVTAIVVPVGPKTGRVAYEKLSIVAGDFAIVSVATIVAETVTIAVGSCGPKPLFACGLPLNPTALREAAAKLAAASDPPSDHRGSAGYRRKVLPELVCRAVRTAIS
jgi:aerobic carbon-monoxide dehydrogenase medium subunit